MYVYGRKFPQVSVFLVLQIVRILIPEEDAREKDIGIDVETLSAKIMPRSVVNIWTTYNIENLCVW